jgi:hypothetical protein
MIDAYVLMDNQVHLLLQTPRANLSSVLITLKRGDGEVCGGTITRKAS